MNLLLKLMRFSSQVAESAMYQILAGRENLDKKLLGGDGLPRSWRVHVLSAKVQVRCFVHGPVWAPVLELDCAHSNRKFRFFYKFRCRIGNMPYVDSLTCGSVSMSWKVCLTELVNWCRVSTAWRWLIGAAWAPQYFCAACQLAIYKLNPFMVGDWPWINLYLYPLKSHSDRSLFILYWRVLTNPWVWMHVNASIMTGAIGLGFYRIHLVRWRRNMRKKHTHTYTPNVASSRFSA